MTLVTLFNAILFSHPIAGPFWGRQLSSTARRSPGNAAVEAPGMLSDGTRWEAEERAWA